MENSRPVIPWIGGKRRLAKHILPLISQHDCYIEPFCGAAAIYFMKPPAKVEVVNDLNGELINLYRIIKHHLEPLINEFKWTLISREQFNWLKITPESTLTDIQRAARFYYLQKMTFGGKVNSRSFGTSAVTPPRLNLLRLEEDLSAAHLRLSRTYIEHLHWQECIERYDRDHSVTFCDPPYWGTEGYGIDFGFDEYRTLADVARRAKGRVLITVNDIPEMREVFAGLTMQTMDINYTVGGGGTTTPSRELLIRNWA